MDFPFLRCIVTDESYLSHQVRELLGYPHAMTCILFDLKIFAEEMQKLGEEKVVAYLNSREQEYLSRLTSGKRKREWLGGRFAAKYAAAEVLSENGGIIPWYNLAIVTDENGRPFLATAKNRSALPDISISHSGGLAAAMAVNKGLCGIDIQVVTPQVVKVRERFCTTDEEQVLYSYFRASYTKHVISLTKLWAAKEALRKIANTASLPGFLALELTGINETTSHKDPALWKFMFIMKYIDINGNPANKKCCVAVSLIADYALAHTTRNDTVG
jgi:holo-[acyl-carrier protein] synthase